MLHRLYILLTNQRLEGIKTKEGCQNLQAIYDSTHTHYPHTCKAVVPFSCSNTVNAPASVCRLTDSVDGSGHRG